MPEKLTTFTRVFLWLELISSAIFGFSMYIAPMFTNNLLNQSGTDFSALACIGGFLVAAFVGSAFSLASGKWSEVRITVYYLITWSVLNGLRLGYELVIHNQGELLINTLSCLLIGLGLIIGAMQQQNASPGVKSIRG